MVGLLGWGGSTRGTETNDFSRYQVIIDHAPFGATAGAAGTAAPQPSFADKFAFLGVVPSLVDPRLLAIIQDKERNRVELKAEGEMLGDVKLMRIEIDPAKLVLQHLLDVATLSYQPRAGGTAPSAVPGAPGAPGAPPTFAMPPGAPGTQLPTLPGNRLGRRMPFRRENQ